MKKITVLILLLLVASVTYFPAYATEIHENITRYEFDLPSDEEILKIHEAEFNNNLIKSDFTTFGVGSGGSWDYVLSEVYYKRTGPVKIAGQPINGTSSTFGHYIYYKDGRDIVVDISFSVGGETVGASVGIGKQVANSTQYGIYIRGDGRRYLAYADKELKFYVYEKYWIHPATGQRIYSGLYTRSELYAIDFTARAQ